MSIFDICIIIILSIFDIVKGHMKTGTRIFRCRLVRRILLFQIVVYITVMQRIKASLV